MGMIDDIRSAKSRSSARPCRVCDILDDLPPDEAAALRGVLNDQEDGRISTTELARILNNNGHRVGKTTVGTHRNEGHA